MSDIAYVRTEMLPDRPPPPNTVGAIGWMRANLFSNLRNSVLTVISFVIVVMIINAVVRWAISPTWPAESLAECRQLAGADHGKACWGVIRDRWFQLLFGFYPPEYVWRPILTFSALVVALAPVLFPSVPRKLFWFTAVYPFLMPWLLWGGSFWAPVSAALGFLLGFVVYRFLEKSAGTLTALVAGVLAAVIWWLFLGSGAVSLFSNVAGLDLATVTSRDFGGFMLSLTIGVVAIACSLPLGIVLALGRQSDLLIVKSLCVGFIEFIRGVPLITLLFVASTLLNIFLPPGTNFDIILRVMIMATLFSAAYMAEVIRGGLAALPKGQYEAAASLGLTYWQSQRLVIMPQALKISIPGIVSTFIGMFKDTTLVSIIGLLDPLGVSTAIRSNQEWSGIVWELYGFVALIFFLFCFSMSRYSMYLERRLQTGHK